MRLRQRVSGGFGQVGEPRWRAQWQQRYIEPIYRRKHSRWWARLGSKTDTLALHHGWTTLTVFCQRILGVSAMIVAAGLFAVSVLGWLLFRRDRAVR